MDDVNKEKPTMYFHDIRWDIIKLVETNNNNILDIGCGSGNTGLKLKELNKAETVTGIEVTANIAHQAKAKLDNVICHDVETLNFSEYFNKDSFDYIILADILEHLYNPWKLILTLVDYLRKDGYIIASFPNVRFWKVLKSVIIDKSWEYQPDGVLDITHIRFFAKRDMSKMFDVEQLKIEKIVPKFKFSPNNRYNALNALTFHLIEELITRQYVIKVKKIC